MLEQLICGFHTVAPQTEAGLDRVAKELRFARTLFHSRQLHHDGAGGVVAQLSKTANQVGPVGTAWLLSQCQYDIVSAIRFMPPNLSQVGHGFFITATPQYCQATDACLSRSGVGAAF